MPRSKLPTISIYKPGTWHAAVGAAVQEVIPREVLRRLKRMKAEKMYADSLSYLDEAYREAGGLFDDETLTAIMAAIISRLGYFRCYHGCRPLTLESYYREGLLPLTRERLAQQAYGIFQGAYSIDELRREAETADLSTRLGHVYFMADDEEMIQFCGHYLIYGSEGLCCMWDGKDAKANNLFQKCRERQRALGIPTIFECDVPVRWLTPTWRYELARTLLTFYFKLMSETPEGPETWSRNWGFWISRRLPPGNLKRHYHPDQIPDFLRIGQVYQHPVTTCPYCSPQSRAG